MKALLLGLIGVIYISSLERAFAQPKPFGLELGVHTKEETLEVIKKEGGKVKNKTLSCGWKSRMALSKDSPLFVSTLGFLEHVSNLRTLASFKGS